MPQMVVSWGKQKKMHQKRDQGKQCVFVQQKMIESLQPVKLAVFFVRQLQASQATGNRQPHGFAFHGPPGASTLRSTAAFSVSW